MDALDLIIILTAFAFSYYGIGCLFFSSIKEEFVRYGIPDYRRLCGFFQLTGAIGLITGIFFPIIGIMAAVGLSLLMLLGLITRIKIKDNFLQSFPALFFMLLNAVIAFLLFKHL